MRKKSTSKNFHNECPECGCDDIMVSDIDGYICEGCRCWWAAYDDGSLMQIRQKGSNGLDEEQGND